ncbi:MAG TPA: hypothetical protein VHQ65_11270 [Thermoanaerobaculia bacterium]|nr:hypothetical protein [Thermoanaerobaculia bacterium]
MPPTEKESEISVDDGEPCMTPPKPGTVEKSGTVSSDLTLAGAENG